MMTRKRILLVDDNAADVYMATEELSKDYELETVFTVEAAIEKLKLWSYDLVITDLSLTDGFGLKIVNQFKPYAPVVVLSGIGNGMMTERAKKHGASGFVNKRYIKDLRGAVADALE